MEFGASMFFTDYSMGPAELARALEERGFHSVWAPEHSHIPLSRKSPFPAGGELPKQYYDVMDPFVTLSAAAAATTMVTMMIRQPTSSRLIPASRLLNPAAPSTTAKTCHDPAAAGTTIAGSADVTLALIGLALLAVGLLFKVGAVPFGSSVPVGYQGAQAPITGMMPIL